MDSVGAYEAKTHLPRLLDEVEAGRSIVITKHGRPVARLVPMTEVATTSRDADALLARLREARKGVTLGSLSIKQLREEGRK